MKVVNYIYVESESRIYVESESGHLWEYERQREVFSEWDSESDPGHVKPWMRDRWPLTSSEKLKWKWRKKVKVKRPVNNGIEGSEHAGQPAAREGPAEHFHHYH